MRNAAHDVEREVFRRALEFREAIIRTPPRTLPLMTAFPLGACGDASPLLGEYLHEQGLGAWRYVSGQRVGDLYSHAWIEQDGLIVDITADQFDDVDEPVIVTRDRSWHTRSLHSPEPVHDARLGTNDERTRTILTEVYERIRTVL